MSFVKTHLKLDKEKFIPAGTGMIIEQPCDYTNFKKLMKRVGEPSNWYLREEYQLPEKENTLKKVFNKGNSRLWLYLSKDVVVGFCQVAQVQDLSSLFKNTKDVVEMYKTGLFPEYTGKGFGKKYVSSVLSELFKDHDTVYLNTRNTNIVNSVPFWQSFGFEIIHTETLPDDLVI